jgi:nucleolar protein 58
MLVLFETPAGYALFKVSDEKKLKKVDNIMNEFETAEKSHDFVKLKAFYRFADTTEAVAAASALIESKLSSELKSFLKKNIVKKELTDELAVADAKLGGLIKEKLDIPVSAARVADSVQGRLGVCAGSELDRETHLASVAARLSICRRRIARAPTCCSVSPTTA